MPIGRNLNYLSFQLTQDQDSTNSRVPSEQARHANIRDMPRDYLEDALGENFPSHLSGLTHQTPPPLRVAPKNSKFECQQQAARELNLAVNNYRSAVEPDDNKKRLVELHKAVCAYKKAAMREFNLPRMPERTLDLATAVPVDTTVLHERFLIALDMPIFDNDLHPHKAYSAVCDALLAYMDMEAFKKLDKAILDYRISMGADTAFDSLHEAACAFQRMVNPFDCRLEPRDVLRTATDSTVEGTLRKAIMNGIVSYKNPHDNVNNILEKFSPLFNAIMEYRDIAPQVPHVTPHTDSVNDENPPEVESEQLIDEGNWCFSAPEYEESQDATPRLRALLSEVENPKFFRRMTPGIASSAAITSLKKYLARCPIEQRSERDHALTTLAELAINLSPHDRRQAIRLLERYLSPKLHDDKSDWNVPPIISTALLNELPSYNIVSEQGRVDSLATLLRKNQHLTQEEINVVLIMAVENFEDGNAVSTVPLRGELLLAMLGAVRRDLTANTGTISRDAIPPGDRADIVFTVSASIESLVREFSQAVPEFSDTALDNVLKDINILAERLQTEGQLWVSSIAQHPCYLEYLAYCDGDLGELDQSIIDYAGNLLKLNKCLERIVEDSRYLSSLNEGQSDTPSQTAAGTGTQ